MAGQVASSRRKQSAGRNRQPPSRRAPEHKILRIGIIHNGRIVEERLIPAGQGVSVGDSPKCTVVISDSKLARKKFDLFTEKQGRYALNFTTQMHGKVSVAEQIETLAKLAERGVARKRSDHFSLHLNDRNRGKVYVGDHTILFQFVTPPPQPARQRSKDFHSFNWGEVDWVFLAILLLSALLHTAGVIWIESQPPPKQLRLEDFPDRFVRMLLPEDEPEPVAEEVVDAPVTDEGAGEDATPAPEVAAEPEESGGGEEDAPEEPAESAEDRAERIADEASSKGLLALIGTTGDSSTGDAVADLLSDANSLSDDVGAALANSSGVAIGRRDSDQSGLRGGGGGDGAAGDAGVGAAKGGKGGSVEKKKTEIKGTIKTGAADISSSPEDQQSIAKTMKRYTGRIKQCYERQLKSDPDLKGKVSVSFEIGTDGNVSGVGIEENSTGNAELATCIKREVGRIRFVPPPEDDVEVAGYPFILAPG
jgi:outer membrane biosynthesis protein TonB